MKKRLLEGNDGGAFHRVGSEFNYLIIRVFLTELNRDSIECNLNRFAALKLCRYILNIGHSKKSDAKQIYNYVYCSFMIALFAQISRLYLSLRNLDT